MSINLIRELKSPLKHPDLTGLENLKHALKVYVIYEMFLKFASYYLAKL